MEKYNPEKIEKKWQKFWAESGIYRNYDRPKKFYTLDMFPYPSGAGLHVGHPKGYIATDVFSRFKMLQDYSVLHPMGWDSFGLPAENYAIKMKMHPRIAVEKNIATFKRQLEMFGFTYDWNREITTSDPNYYRWTQWIFLKLFEKGLAYESNEPVNWCPSCKTVLSNEDLEQGLCERCGSQVIQRRLRQWVLRMTAYAERLLVDLDSKELEWEEQIVEQQKNWIGKSEGVEFLMKIAGTDESIGVYTTRVDTVFGMTYAVVAPEHPIIEKFKEKIENYGEVEKYLVQAQNKSNLERTELQKEKTGVELEGIKVINPFNGKEIPLFVADYVLGSYGTGAVMAVPAHDERDFEFAKKYNLPIKTSIEPLFITTDGPDRARPDEPFVERDAITAIVKHWKDDLYIVLKWKKADWRTFITGGPENGQSMEEGARTEVLEETGYKNLKLIRELHGFHSKFYHIPKNKNKFVHMKPFYFELENDECEKISEAEKEKHEILWVGKENVENTVTPEGHKYIWGILNGLEKAFCDDGIVVNSGEYDGLTSTEARQKMTEWLEKEGIGKKKVNYKMRDWIFSRQKYWGEPIPIVHCERCGTVALPEDQLPLTLPEVKSYEPTETGESPLANIPEWVNTTCPKCKGPAKRETNTMPQWAGSSWYYLRYIDPKNNQALIDKEKEKEWMPVDLYVGGIEHATRHLLYARFWHKFLFDIGVVSTNEPFKRLIHVGLILAEDGRKMSKRWNNVINPDDVIKEFGADSMRLYEMFMGPFTQSCAWSTAGVSGVRRFLNKIWDYYDSYIDFRKKYPDATSGGAMKLPMLNKTIKKVSEDIESFRFNTAISQMMILVNDLREDVGGNEKMPAGMHYTFFDRIEDMKKILLILSPFAPHLAEELWEKISVNPRRENQCQSASIFLQKWPEFDPELIQDEEITVAVQVNGKLRDALKVPSNISEEEMKARVAGSEKVKPHLEGKEIKKVIFVKGRLINFVV